MQSSYIHIHNPDKRTLLDFLIYSFTSHFVGLVLIATKHISLASYKQKTRICLEWSDKANKPAEFILCLKTGIPPQMWSTNILNLLFNEQVMLSLTSGSVLDPYTTLLLCFYKCLCADQSENLVILEKLLKNGYFSAISVPHYNPSCSPTPNTHKKDNRKGLREDEVVLLVDNAC